MIKPLPRNCLAKLSVGFGIGAAPFPSHVFFVDRLIDLGTHYRSAWAQATISYQQTRNSNIGNTSNPGYTQKLLGL